MGFDISRADIMKVLDDESLVDEVVKKVVDDPDVLADLAEDMADEIADYLEDDPVIRQKLMDAAIKSPDFKKRVIKELVDELGD